MLRIILPLLFAITFYSFSTSLVYSDELENQLQETTSELNSAVNEKNTTQDEIAKLESIKLQYQGTLNSLRYSFENSRNQLSTTEQTISDKESEIASVHEELELYERDLQTRTEYANQTVRNLYITNHKAGLTSVLIPDQAALLTQSFFYHNAIVTNLRDQIINLNQQIQQVTEIKAILEDIKIQLELEREALVAQQASLQTQIASTQTQYDSTKNQQQNLNQVLIGLDQQIANLTNRQKEILAAKAAAALASTSVGNTEINQAAIEKDPPTDGNVYFSFWTYGYPHRVGMSQYGAYGRAKAGQAAEEVLTTYYRDVVLTAWDAPVNITISTSGGNQSIHFENEYLMGIGEMPSCWGTPENGGLEALKAQAVAARTYALAYTNNGTGAICTDQNCQVYVGSSKVSGACGEYWKQAVEETAGLVLTHNNSPITAWYASTSGGFTISSEEAWGGNRAYTQSITDVDASGKPFEGPNHGNSPWYFKAWGNKPWLSFAEVTDLMNASLLPESYNTTIDSMTTTEIESALVSEGISPISNLNSLEIIDEDGNPGAGTANVAYVRAYYNESSTLTEVTGKRFKFVYNLRSPGTNAIWTTRFDVRTAAEL